MPTPADEDFDEFDGYDLIATYDGTLWKTHGPAKCEGARCTLHNPSDHHMREWPITLNDGGGRTERVCPHGVSHPDPDHVSYVRRRFGRLRARITAVHGGCDGCCARSTHPDQSST